MSSILYGIKEITVDDMINEQVTYKLWENAGRKIMEAQLTADQINQLFANIEQGATDAGGNRTMLGKGKDAASAVNKAWEELKTKVQNSGPIKNVDAMYDQAAEKLKQATGGDQGVMKYVQKYRDFAKKHPVAQSIIYSALIAAAGISGAGLGGAAALGLFKMVDKLLQGEKFSSAAYSGAKTGAMAYGASKVGDLIRGQNAGGAGDAAASAAGNMAPNAIAKNALQIVKEKIQNGEVTDWNSYQKAVNSALEEAIKAGGGQATGISKQMAGKILSNQLDRYALDAAGQFSGSGPEKIEKIISALGGQVDQEKMAAAKRAVAALRGANESIELNEANIRLVFSKVSLEHDKMLAEGLWDTIKGKAAQVGKNLTTKVTADKLQSAWKKAGSPTDSAEIAKLLTQNGVAQEVVDKVFTQMKIPTTAPAQPAAQTQKSQGQQAAPAQQAAKPAAQAQTQAAAKPAKPGAPTVKQAQPQNRVGGVRQQAGTFAYNPLAEKRKSGEEEVIQGNPEDNFTVADIHELEKIKDFATLKARAKALIKGKPIRRMKPEKIAYFYDRVDTLTSPMKVIKMMYDLLLAGEGLKTIGSWNSMDPNSYAKRFAEDQNTGSVIYSFDQEDPLNKSEILILGGAGRYTFEGLRNKARKEAAALAQDLEIDSPYVFERSAYNIKQLANTLNTIKKAYAEMEQIKKGGGIRSRNIKGLEETHSTGTTIGSAGIGGGSGLGIEKSPIEKVLEKPLGETIQSSGGMGQAYRKFTPKTSKAEDLEEEQAPMFTPEDEAKMVNANDPKSDGWRRTESAIMKGLQTEGNVITWSKDNPPPPELLLNTLIQILMKPENQKSPQDLVSLWNEKYGLKHTLGSLRQYAQNDYKKMELSKALQKAALANESSEGK